MQVRRSRRQFIRPLPPPPVQEENIFFLCRDVVAPLPPPELLSGNVDRGRIPAQLKNGRGPLLYAPRVVHPAEPIPYIGNVARRPLPPTGLEAIRIPSRFERPPEPLLFTGRVVRRNLPHDVDPPYIDAIAPHRFARGATQQPLPYSGQVSRAALPNTGEFIASVDSLRLHRFARNQLEPIPFCGRIVRQPLPPSGEQYGIQFPRFIRPMEPLAFPGRFYRQPLPPTGQTAAQGAKVAAGAPFLGGLHITHLEWLSTTALLCEFESIYTDQYHYQLYAGRNLIGTTADKTSRRIVAQLKPSEWPQFLCLLAVPPEAPNHKYGDRLPDSRAYNRAKIAFTAAGWPADSKHIEVTAGTTPGGAVSATNVLELVDWEAQKNYLFESEPMPGSGVWNFEIAGRDDKLSSGNRGEVAALSLSLLSQPPDVLLRSDGGRFDVSIASQQITINFSEP